MSTAKLTKEYDRIRALRDGLAAELQLDITGEGRRRRVQAIADALRAGDPVPDVHHDRARRQLELDGVDRAIDGVALDLAEALAKGRKRAPTTTAIPDLTATGAEMVEAIVSSYDAADRSRAATQATLDTRRRYEAALEAFNGRRTELMQEGVEPAAASDQAKAELGSQADDLWPPGSAGLLSFHGRPRGETLTADAHTTVPA
jgi:hypothetical protein